MLKSTGFKLVLVLAAAPLAPVSAAAQDYLQGGYYFYSPLSSGFGPPADLNTSAPPIYGYAPPAAYGYAPPGAYGYAPRRAYGYAPPGVYGYVPPPPPAAYGYQGYGFVATPPYNPYYFGTGAWWNEMDRQRGGGALP
jgi:hypothetical protein